MKWTNRQKIAGGVLLAAAAAFAADRFTAGGTQDPTTGTAGSAVATPSYGREAGDRPVPVGPSPAAKQPASPTASAASAATAVLAQRLDRVAAVEGLVPGRTADGFQPPEAWYPIIVAKQEVRPVVEDRVTPFKAKHKLTAVMRGGAKGQRGVAVLGGAGGGMAVRVGQAVDGFVLTSVREGAAVFVAGVDEVELALDRPAISSVGGVP